MNRLESISNNFSKSQFNDGFGLLSDDVEWMIERLERYEKALEWYADESNYDIDDVTTDCEKKAQEALKEP